MFTGYRDARGRWRASPPESVCAVLAALGAEGLEEGSPPTATRLRDAVRCREAELRRRLIEPVVVAWDGRLPPDVLGPEVAPECLEVEWTLEDGGESRPSADAGSLAPFGGLRLPFGYHRLHVTASGARGEAVVISAPRRCWTRDGRAGELREWGVFSPLYALRSDRDWGAGDLAELQTFQEVVAGSGGSLVATLPLLAGFLDVPFEPAPYRPVSRLFWNEFYLAVERVPEWERCAEAQGLWASAGMQSRVARLRAESSVDYREVMAVKREVLERLSAYFFERGAPERKAAFAAFVRDNPDVEEYAAFRAHLEATAGGEARRYHLYCQWQMEEQLSALSERPAPGPPATGLFLDLPVGVHPDGFDTWRWPGLFVRGMSVGAPPDSFFARGQRWECPPPHPAAARAQGHEYFARCVRRQMRHARYLRIDHVMGLHRLFWVPEGREALDGVYVAYPAEELYAVLCLESHRNHTVVVGEDLGTVPPGVRTAMRRHGVLGTWVLQASLRPRAARAVAEVPRQVAVSLGTHDMFPFAGFVAGRDIAAQVRTGQAEAEGARRRLAARRALVDRLAAFLRVCPSAPAAQKHGPGWDVRLLHRALAHLAASRAAVVTANLDDLLLETRPQNQPGTGHEQANWRRKVAATPDEIRRVIAEAGRVLTLPRSRE